VVLTLRLEYGGKVYGLLSSSVPSGFAADEEEKSLFEEVAGDVAFALHSIEQEEEGQRAQEALRDREKKYRFLVESLNEGIWVIDAKGRTTFVNPPMAKMLGYSVEKMQGRELFSFMAGPAVELCNDYLKRRREGIREQGEFELIRKDGSKINVIMETAPLKDDKGKYRGAISGVLDITERKKAEEARRESEERYRDLVETTDDLVQSVSPDDSIKFVNHAWRETLGYSEEEIRSMKILDIIHPDSRAHCTEIFQRVVAGEKAENIEAKFLTKDGRTIMVEGSASCRFVDGRPATTYGIFHDVTRRKEAEEATRKLEVQKLVVEKMKELDRIKSEFVSTVTHELRTPMTPLRSTIEMLLDGSLGELTDRQEKFIKMMARNVDRLAQFTTEVLTLSRLESGRFKIEPRMLALRETLEPVMELMEQKAQSKNSTVTLDIDAEVFAYGDADSLSIVVTNLTNNAIVHTADGTTVTVSAIKIDENSVEIAVADNGQGIPKESLENLFDRFYQAKRKAGSGYQGTGVGLAVSKALIEAMGGEISVESHVGEGTVFRFTLPATLPQKDNEEAKE
jgi:PAS domain S-box-containing protein